MLQVQLVAGDDTHGSMCKEEQWNDVYRLMGWDVACIAAIAIANWKFVEFSLR